MQELHLRPRRSPSPNGASSSHTALTRRTQRQSTVSNSFTTSLLPPAAPECIFAVPVPWLCSSQAAETSRPPPELIPPSAPTTPAQDRPGDAGCGHVPGSRPAAARPQEPGRQQHLPRHPPSPAPSPHPAQQAKFHTQMEQPACSGRYFPGAVGVAEPPACRERGRHLHTSLQTGGDLSEPPSAP